MRSSGPSGPIRLLRGLAVGDGKVSLAQHIAQHGPLPRHGTRGGHNELVHVIRQSGLVGRGGANFPTASKLAAVAGARGNKIVVANGCESEPASAKDRFLLARAPHLVLDGLQVAASAVGADELFLATSPALAGLVMAALDERSVFGADRRRPVVVSVPEHFVAGESSALVNFLNGGPGLPTVVPPRPDQKGVDGRPTLVQNVETLAHIALIARHGPQWFRTVGTVDDPGSTLVTVRGAIRNPGVYEVPRGLPLSGLVRLAGGISRPVQAFLTGGYGGTWLPAGAAWDTPLSEEPLAARGGTLGAGLVFVFPEGCCGLSEAARILAYLAREGAGQCGPCSNGLPAMASALAALARADAPADVLERLQRWAGQVAGRGACHHPDGAVRMLATALSTFSADVGRHVAQISCRTSAEMAPSGLVRARDRA